MIEVHPEEIASLKRAICEDTGISESNDGAIADLLLRLELTRGGAREYLRTRARAAQAIAQVCMREEER